MKFTLNITLFILAFRITFAQAQFNIAIPSDQNCIDGIVHPLIQLNIDSLVVYVSTKYRNQIGGTINKHYLDYSGNLLSITKFLDSINFVIIGDSYMHSNEVLVCGNKFSLSDTNQNFWFAALDKNLDTLWTKEKRTINNSSAFQKIIKLRNGNIALVGSDNEVRTSGSLVHSTAVFLIADSLGNNLNYIEINDLANYPLFYNLAEDNLGNIYACGIVKKNDLNHDALIAKISPDGKLLWRKQIPSLDYSEGLNYCIPQPDGSIYFIGVSYKADFFADDFSLILIIHVDPNGNIISTQRIMRGFENFNQNCVLDRQGNIICAGYYKSERNVKSDGWICKFNTQGDSIWSRIIDYSPTSTEQFFNISNAADGGYYLTGYTFITGNNSSKAWIVKVDSLGCVVPNCTTGTNIEEEGFSKGYTLYPNPAHGIIHIDFNHSLDADAKLYVYNIQGTLLFTEVLKQGTDFHRIDIRNLLEGMYIIQLKNKSGVIGEQKLVVGN